METAKIAVDSCYVLRQLLTPLPSIDFREIRDLHMNYEMFFQESRCVSFLWFAFVNKTLYFLGLFWAWFIVTAGGHSTTFQTSNNCSRGDIQQHSKQVTIAKTCQWLLKERGLGGTTWPQCFSEIHSNSIKNWGGKLSSDTVAYLVCIYIKLYMTPAELNCQVFWNQYLTLLKGVLILIRCFSRELCQPLRKYNIYSFHCIVFG